MIKLIIKGAHDDAKAALQKHKLWDYVQGGLHPRPSIYTSASMVEALVPDDKQLTVTTWYCEQIQTPYPPGTLLHYSYPK